MVIHTKKVQKSKNYTKIFRKCEFSHGLKLVKLLVVFLLATHHFEMTSPVDFTGSRLFLTGLLRHFDHFPRDPGIPNQIIFINLHNTFSAIVFSIFCITQTNKKL